MLPVAKKPSPSKTNSTKVNFANKTFLVIDDSITMRTSLRITVTTFGATKIDMVSNAVDAFNRMSAREYDVILCDYDLGDGKDGQTLLEEAQRRNLIKPSTIFVMVTAEKKYERVVSAAELAPDDYLLKPFSGDMLHSRLEKIAIKKQLLKPVYQLLEKEDFKQAVAISLSLAEQNPGMAFDFWRLAGETLLRTESFQDAAAAYQKVLDKKPLPWARLGHARALLGKGQSEESALELESLVNDHGDYLPAYDWLSKAYLVMGNDEKAKEVLRNAVGKAPRTVARQQTLGHVAYQADDLDTAEQALSAAIDFGKYSDLIEPRDYAGLAQVFTDKRDFSRATQVLDTAVKTFQNSDEVLANTLLVRSSIAAKSGNAAEASRLFKEAHAFAERLPVDEQLTLSLVKAAFESGNEEAGKSLVREMVRTHHHNTAVLGQVEKTLTRAGQGEAGTEMVKAAKREVIQVNNRAVKLAQAGDLQGAMDMLITAADEIPNNNVVVINAAKAILAWMGKEGWDKALGQQALTYLQTVRGRIPKDPQLLATWDSYVALATKFGVPLRPS